MTASFVVKRLFAHDKAYIFQNPDRRVVFAIPFHRDYTLIGTTDNDFAGDLAALAPSREEISYLRDAVSTYFRDPVSAGDVVWAYAGVRVNAVAPGFIGSSGLNNYPEAARPLLRKVREFVPLKRMGTESEVSAAIVFLLCEASAFINGSCLRVDGGHPNARRDWDMPEHDRSVPYRGFPLESRVSFLDPSTDSGD